MPKYYGGFSNTFSYKNFSISVDFYFNFGNYVNDSWANYLTDGQYSLSYGRYAKNLQRWQKAGDITDVPKYVYNSTSNSNAYSSRFLYKGDYIRLRNIELGYRLPNETAKKIHLNSLRFYVRGTNFWTKTYDKNLPFDPEQTTLSNGNLIGVSNLNIPLQKSVTVGLNIGF